MDHGVSQTVSCWSLTTDIQVQSQACLHGIYGGQSGTWRGFLKGTLVFSCLYHSSIAQYSSITSTISFVTNIVIK